jgi:beta-glucosidase
MTEASLDESRAAREAGTAMTSRAEHLLEMMTLDEKIGQITQVERSAITPQEVADLGIGSVLSGGGGNPDPNTPATWRAMVDEDVDASRRSRLGVPILYGTDAVHGKQRRRCDHLPPQPRPRRCR